MVSAVTCLLWCARNPPRASEVHCRRRTLVSIEMVATSVRDRGCVGWAVDIIGHDPPMKFREATMCQSQLTDPVVVVVLNGLRAPCHPGGHPHRPCGSRHHHRRPRA